MTSSLQRRSGSSREEAITPPDQLISHVSILVMGQSQFLYAFFMRAEVPLTLFIRARG
jgi:hypothetical protein